MVKMTLLSFFSALFGGLLCFAGYRFFMVMLPVWSFFGGFWLGNNGVQLLFGQGFLSSATALTVGIVLGILLAVFSWQFYELGVALLGAVVGAWFGSGLMHFLGFGPGGLTALVSLALALGVGLFTYIRDWQKYWVMILTAIFGANAIVLALLLPLGRISIDDLQGAGTAIRPILQDSTLWSLLWIGLAIAGIVIQYRSYLHVIFARDEFFKYWS